MFAANNSFQPFIHRLSEVPTNFHNPAYNPCESCSRITFVSIFFCVFFSLFSLTAFVEPTRQNYMGNHMPRTANLYSLESNGNVSAYDTHRAADEDV